MPDSPALSDFDDFDDFIDRLERRLAQPLPGLPVQLAMAPRPRPARFAPGIDPSNPIPAAVLALFFPSSGDGPDRGGGPRLVLTRRSEHVAAHKGQICLPGGALDAGETAVGAALREVEEEIGVARDVVRVVGRLTPVFIPVSGFRMEPFVAATHQRPDFRIAAHEVDELIELPLAQLTDPALRGERHAMRDGHEIVIPYFEIAGKHAWGATAMVLAELCAVLSELE